MKEFNKTVDLESLSKGLRRDFRSPRNKFSLLSCFNAKPSPYGIVAYDPVEVPISVGDLNGWGIDLEWPYPQLFKGDKYTILMTGNRAFYVNEDEWSLIEMDLYNVENVNSVITPHKTGHPWSFIDCHDTWFMTNGGSIIFQTNHRTMITGGATLKVLVENNIPTEAGAYYKGRIVLGGFDPDKFWKSGWVTAWQTTDNDGETNILQRLNNLGDNFILWSSIGGGDIPLFLMLPSIADSGFLTSDSYGTTRNLWYDMMKRQEWGFAPMPWKGKIRAMKQLGEVLVIYGADGICAVRNISEPVPTLGVVNIPSIARLGIPCNGAVGGDGSVHVFVDVYGVVWRMGADLQPERLGYREFCKNLLGNEIMISHSQSENEFWISSDFETFHLTQTGMCEVDQVITSMIDAQGRRYGFWQGVDEASIQSIVTWDTIDFGNRGQKTIEQVQLPTDLGSFENVEFSLFWRNNTYEEFRQSPWKKVSANGVAWPVVTAVDFRPSLRFTNLQKAKVEYITFSYKQTDKRYIRGAYATEVA